MTIKAIETRYKGYRFRSRLEARWAVFFDALGLQWEYEPEGFDLGEAGWYLPDFWIPTPNHWSGEKAGYWVEIKARNRLTEKEKEKAIALGIHSAHHVLILEGNPWPGECSLHRTGGWDGLREFNAFMDSDPDLHFMKFYNSYPCGSALISYEDPDLYINADWMGAATKARAARFEHGECG